VTPYDNPYAPPADAYRPQQAPPPHLGSGGNFYKPLGLRTPITIFFLVANLLCDLALVGATAMAGDLEKLGEDPTMALTYAGAALLNLGSLLAAGIVFLIWFHRACANAWALGAFPMSITPGWAVGGFFVPFLNLVRPFQAMREVWHGSRREQGQGTPLIGLWWGTWLASGVLGWVGAKADSLGVDVASFVIRAASGVLLILLMRQIGRNQEETSVANTRGYL
jgi:hypothetical protein